MTTIPLLNMDIYRSSPSPWWSVWWSWWCRPAAPGIQCEPLVVLVICSEPLVAVLVAAQVFSPSRWWSWWPPRWSVWWSWWCRSGFSPSGSPWWCRAAAADPLRAWPPWYPLRSTPSGGGPGGADSYLRAVVVQSVDRSIPSPWWSAWWSWRYAPIDSEPLVVLAICSEPRWCRPAAAD